MGNEHQLFVGRFKAVVAEVSSWSQAGAPTEPFDGSKMGGDPNWRMHLPLEACLIVVIVCMHIRHDATPPDNEMMGLSMQVVMWSSRSKGREEKKGCTVPIYQL